MELVCSVGIKKAWSLIRCQAAMGYDERNAEAIAER
jgi:hypothetical protein